MMSAKFFKIFVLLQLTCFSLCLEQIFAVGAYFSAELRLDDFQHFVNARFSLISSLIFA